MELTALEEQYRQALCEGTDEEVAALERAIDAEETRRNQRLTDPYALTAAALWYASEGIPVFPIIPCQKRPLTRHGFKDATTDADQIRAWWDATPNANIATPTGHSFDVIDIDGPDGYHSIIDMRRNNHLPKALGKVSTPRGAHLYVSASGKGNTTSALPGVDYRGKGGYVLIPPSRTENGTYQWLTPLYA